MFNNAAPHLQNHEPTENRQIQRFKSTHIHDSHCPELKQVQ